MIFGVSCLKDMLVMNDKEILKKCYEDIIWMAIRYANGRQTYAPSMVRDSIEEFQKVFPDWKPKEDKTLDEFDGNGFKDDYLNDLC